jgi:hypothetical protein
MYTTRRRHTQVRTAVCTNGGYYITFGRHKGVVVAVKRKGEERERKQVGGGGMRRQVRITKQKKKEKRKRRRRRLHNFLIIRTSVMDSR